MSIRYPGGLITKTPTTPSASSAPGIWTMEQALEYIKAGTWPTNSDLYFEYVTLLLHGNGTNGAQNNTFLDSSTNNFTITRNGNTTQGSFSPFSRADGEWSNYFDGSGDNLVSPSSTQFTFGTGDFTIEGWARLNSSTQYYPPLFAIGTGDSTGETALAIVFGNDGYGYRLGAIFSGTFIDLGVGTGITQSSFTGSSGKHFAMVRNGSTLTIYIDGTSVYSTSNSVNYSGTYTVRIAGYSTIFANGSISNFRIVKGTAVYTANFTPPTSPLTAITNTSLLTCQSNRFKDNSTNAFTLTVNGNPSVQVSNLFNPATAYTAASNGGSGYFDGSGDYLNAGSSSAFAMGTGAYTVEMWVYVPSNANQAFFAAASPGGLICIIDNGALIIAARGSAATLSGGSVQANAWNHLVFCRASTASNQTAIFVNGARTALGTDPNNYTVTGPAYVGALDVGGYNVTGYISGLRVVKGTAVYDPTQTTLTVPTSPPTNITNTSLLLNFINGGIFDNAAMNDLETVGNAQISTAQSKFGGGSMYFDGTGDYLAAPARTNFAFPGDFTVEFWMYLTAVSGEGTTFYVTTSGGINLFMNIGSNWGVARSAVGVDNYFGTTPTQNVWNHIAVARSGSTIKAFVNGSQVFSGTNTSSYVDGPLQLGGSGFGTITGYIDDLRITKGYARYTANFTPPTAPFPDK